MNPLVLLFFAHSTLATFLLGWKLAGQKDASLKNFGYALVLNGLAFAIWSAAVILRPADLALWTGAGAFPFMGTLLFLISSSTVRLDRNLRNRWLGAGVALVAVLFILRSFVYPSQPYFSDEGLFFFNVQPVATAVYLFALSAAAFPAIRAIGQKMKTAYAPYVEAGFITLVLGGFLLLVSTDLMLLYINGWVMGLTYFVLWVSLVFQGKKILK
jgi:hypothetical protein